jgi:hypothetical protein
MLCACIAKNFLTAFENSKNSLFDVLPIFLARPSFVKIKTTICQKGRKTTICQA